jgi:hypothetical protein
VPKLHELAYGVDFDVTDVADADAAAVVAAVGVEMVVVDDFFQGPTRKSASQA